MKIVTRRRGPNAVLQCMFLVITGAAGIAPQWRILYTIPITYWARHQFLQLQSSWWKILKGEEKAFSCGGDHENL